MEGKALGLSWRPCVGATAESNLAKAPPLGIALRSPSHIGRVASNIRLSACPRVPTSGIDKAGQVGRKAKDVDGTLETAGGKIRARQSAQPKATRAACKQGKVGAGSI